MAVAARPFIGKSQKKDSKRSIRASALLQMWRELEGENVLSQSHRSRQLRNHGDSECISRSSYVRHGSENHDDFSQISDEPEKHENSNSTMYEQSRDLGEIELGRVRQVFREWTNICPKGRKPNGFNRKNHSGHCVGDMEHDGLVISHQEIGARRPLRRLCGRQTLLDLSLKAQNERKRELLSLLEQRSVSCFAHRNRIQALLRGRFLRNGRLVVDTRPSSVAATELGFLRQRHAVSDLRVGFLSKLDNSASASVNSTGCDSTYSDENKSETEPTCTEREICSNHIGAGSEGTTTDVRRHMQELEVQNVGGQPVSAPEAEQHGFLTHDDHFRSRFEHINATPTNESELVSADINCSQTQVYNENNEEPKRGVSYIHEVADHTTDSKEKRNEEFDSHDASAQGKESQESVTDIENNGLLCLNPVPFTERDDDGSRQERDRSWQEIADINCSQTQVYNENNEEPKRGVSYIHEVADHTTDSKEKRKEEFDSHDASAQGKESQESVTDIENNGLLCLNPVPFTEWDDGSRQERDRSWQERASSQSFCGPFGNNLEEDDQMQELHDWRSHDLQGANESWRDTPTGEAVGEFDGEIDTFDFLYEDKVNSMELRELFSRRRVSSLLCSSFRERLDRVLQSHAERLGHASDDWELESTSFPPIIEQNQEVLNGNQSIAESESAERNTFSHPLWNEDFQVADWPHHYSNQQLETEWDVINELRIDMARLQEKVNNMEGMLEECMDMQIDLQRSSGDAVTPKCNNVLDESLLDHVKRGICCLCQLGRIDSLLYRCGHMCTCTNCAENLVQSKGHCPICRAPAVEVVRAYFIQ